MTPPVYILGGYQTDFAKAWSRHGQDISDLVRETTLGTLEACGLDAPAIESIHVGNAFAELQRQQAHLGAMVAQVVPDVFRSGWPVVGRLFSRSGDSVSRHQQLS